MSTAPATPEVNGEQTGLAVLTERKTMVVFISGKDKDDNPIYGKTTEDDFNENAKEKGWTEVFRQSFRKYSAGTREGMDELVPLEKEQVAMFNRGISVKQDNKINSLLTATDENGELTFAPVEGDYDLKQVVAAETQRRGLTETEKGIKAIEKLSPESQKQLLAYLESLRASGQLQEVA